MVLVEWVEGHQHFPDDKQGLRNAMRHAEYLAATFVQVAVVRDRKLIMRFDDGELTYHINFPIRERHDENDDALRAGNVISNFGDWWRVQFHRDAGTS